MPKAARETVGERLDLALRRSGLDDYVVAERANVTAAWLSSAKNDRIKNPIVALDKYRAVVGVLQEAGVEDVSLVWLFEPTGTVPIEELAGDMGALEAAIVRQAWPDSTKQALIQMARLADTQKRTA